MFEFSFVMALVGIILFWLGYLCGGYLRSKGFTLTEVCVTACLMVVITGCVQMWHTLRVVPPSEELPTIEVSTMEAFNRSMSAIFDKDGESAMLDFADAITENIRTGMQAKLAPIVAAIRYAENGGKGREYGILHPRVDPTYRSQAGWCAATVQKNWDRYVIDGGDIHDTKAFIQWLGAIYCPIGVDNDPTGLNKHWGNNVTYFLLEHTL